MDNLNLLQPVLQWGQGAFEGWQIASYFIDGQRDPSSKPLDVSVGDTVQMSIELADPRGSWEIAAAVAGKGASSIDIPVSRAGLATTGFEVTYEAYYLNSCHDFPCGVVHWTDFELAVNGKPVNLDWFLWFNPNPRIENNPSFNCGEKIVSASATSMDMRLSAGP